VLFRSSLDRIDNNGNYKPDNCRWATAAEQTRNKQNNVWIEARGLRLTVSDWATELGWKRSTIHMRLRMGWSPEDAVTRPLRAERVIEARGQRKTVGEWAAELGCDKHTLFLRLLRGWSPEDAVTRMVRSRN
jgi:hypothetical protein